MASPICWGCCSKLVRRQCEESETSWLSPAPSEALSASAGRRERSSVSPASVVDTERVVRDSPPSRSSRAFMAWLNADWDMPSSAAARVKLPCSATTAKAARWYRSSPFIQAFIHKPKRSNAASTSMATRRCSRSSATCRE